MVHSVFVLFHESHLLCDASGRQVFGVAFPVRFYVSCLTVLHERRSSGCGKSHVLVIVHCLYSYAAFALAHVLSCAPTDHLVFGYDAGPEPELDEPIYCWPHLLNLVQDEFLIFIRFFMKEMLINLLKPQTFRHAAPPIMLDRLLVGMKNVMPKR